jgi:hypothetical protein
MVKLRVFLALFLATALTGSATAASATKKSLPRSTPKGSVVTDHVPQLDGPLTTLTGPDGRTWAAWAYRAAGELDIAVSSRDANTTTWSAPIFFGRRNRVDEIDPAIAVDSLGAAYVAFATTNPPRVSVAVLPAGSLVWSEPVIVSGTEAASSPALLLVGDRLIVAYRSARGVGMVDFPTVGSGNQINGIQDGPDGVDPLGARDRTARTDNTLIDGGGNPNP